VIRIRDREYDTVELFLQVTRSKHISLLNKTNTTTKTTHPVTEKNPKGGGRKPKYTHEDWLWMSHNTPNEIASRYGVNMAYARMMHKQSKAQIDLASESV